MNSFFAFFNVVKYLSIDKFSRTDQISICKKFVLDLNMVKVSYILSCFFFIVAESHFWVNPFFLRLIGPMLTHRYSNSPSKLRLAG